MPKGQRASKIQGQSCKHAAQRPETIGNRRSVHATQFVVFRLRLQFGRTEILLPSAVHLEERLTVSHSVPAPGQQAVRQKQKQKGFFVSGRCVPKQSLQVKQWPNGKAAGQSLYDRRFEPRSAVCDATAAAKSHQTRIRTTDRKSCVSCVAVRPAVK